MRLFQPRPRAQQKAAWKDHSSSCGSARQKPQDWSKSRKTGPCSRVDLWRRQIFFLIHRFAISVNAERTWEVRQESTRPPSVVTCRNEQMIKDFLKLAVFPNDTEHKNSVECLPLKIFDPMLFSGNNNQITEQPQLFLPSSSCSLSFSTESRSFNASLSEHWAFFFFLGYSIQEMCSRKIKQVFVTFHHEEKESGQ